MREKLLHFKGVPALKILAYETQIGLTPRERIYLLTVAGGECEKKEYYTEQNILLKYLLYLYDSRNISEEVQCVMPFEGVKEIV